MTAIFVLAHGPHVFVASDTKRQIGGMERVAAKTQRWSPRVLVAQAGTGEAVQRLFGQMLSWESRSPVLASTHGLIQVFLQLAVAAQEREIAAMNHKVSQLPGTLVVAEAGNEDGQTPPRISVIDWPSQKVHHPEGSIYADGSAPAEFTQIAADAFEVLKPTEDIEFDAGAWAVHAFEEVLRHEHWQHLVGWPLDLTISRPFEGHRHVVYQRLQQADKPSSLFSFKL